MSTQQIEALIERLELLRRAEKEQALFYRALATQAEDSAPLSAPRFHDLHADEQHHLSRLTARVLELGGRPVDLSTMTVDVALLGAWETVVPAREAAEITRYVEALDLPGVDATTRSLLEDILGVERQHESQLGGKWTMA
jgi:rubrerythrin